MNDIFGLLFVIIYWIEVIISYRDRKRLEKKIISLEIDRDSYKRLYYWELNNKIPCPDCGQRGIIKCLDCEPNHV